MKRAASCVGMLLLAACASSPQAASPLTRMQLPASDQHNYTLPAPSAASLTVLVFFSADCDCQAAHDARLRELAVHYRARGVAFFGVDSEVDATVARDAQEARRRDYPYPLLIDRGARLAQQLGAEYATYTVVLDAQGRTQYRGALDSDHMDLHDAATFYLRDALDDLLAGRPPRRARTEALGCALRLW